MCKRRTIIKILKKVTYSEIKANITASSCTTLLSKLTIKRQAQLSYKMINRRGPKREHNRQRTLSSSKLTLKQLKYLTRNRLRLVQTLKRNQNFMIQLRHTTGL